MIQNLKNKYQEYFNLLHCFLQNLNLSFGFFSFRETVVSLQCKKDESPYNIPKFYHFQTKVIVC